MYFFITLATLFHSLFYHTSLALWCRGELLN